VTPLQIAAKLACRDIYPPIQQNSFWHYFHVGETECGLSIYGNICYLTIQGTVDFSDWLDGFNIAPIKHPVLGNLHSGFDRDLPELISHLRLKLPKNMNVICCGHSAGAAKASLLAARLRLDGINVIQVYLFASPNPAQQEFKHWMQKNIRGLSFWNKCQYIPFLCDPVPKVPFTPWQAPYEKTVITQYPSILKRFFPTEYHSANLYYKKILSS
jgi:hypothetical protein